ncbi:hypothetical protein [Nostoc sp. CHAB 5715]|uniref:hypothetical protein n=1 Tax=Nostoc sp. CHAB 5715 TaxID=2780400 RepID=UPI001E2D66E3|nr:hypothetical protein [Nostoc sp. CHAB 5715]MCC5622045.1 hypothetical protein [Nostoc sp. CHAB 5715]
MMAALFTNYKEDKRTVRLPNTIKSFLRDDLIVFRTYAKIAQKLNLSNRPSGSPVAYGGKPAYSAGSPRRQERQEFVERA